MVVDERECVCVNCGEEFGSEEEYRSHECPNFDPTEEFPSREELEKMFQKLVDMVEEKE